MRKRSRKSDAPWNGLQPIEGDPQQGAYELAMMRTNAHSMFVADAVKQIRRDIKYLQARFALTNEDIAFGVDDKVRHTGLVALSEARQCVDLVETIGRNSPITEYVQLVTAWRYVSTAWFAAKSSRPVAHRPKDKWTRPQLHRFLRRYQDLRTKFDRQRALRDASKEFGVKTARGGKILTEAYKAFGRSRKK